MKNALTIATVFALALTNAHAGRGGVELVTETRVNKQTGQSLDAYTSTEVHFAVGLRIKAIGSSEADCKQTYDEYVQKLELKNEIILEFHPCAQQPNSTEWLGSVLLPKI